MVNAIKVIWAIRTFDGRLKSPFPLPTKRYVLDWAKASESEQAEIMQILELRDQPDRKPLEEGQIVVQHSVGPASANERMLRFRHLFVEEPVENAGRKPTLTCKVFCLGRDYLEDETGQEISMQEMMQIATGNKTVIPFDAENVASLGPCAISERGTWSVDKANTLFNFMQVVRLIGNSTWARKRTTMTVHDFGNKAEAKIECDFPSVESMCAVLTLFRQLYAPTDALMEKTCKAYMEHASNTTKIMWVDHCLQNFKHHLENMPTFMPLQRCTVRELFEAFLYGTGTVHSIKGRNRKNKDKLANLISQYGREKVVMAVNNSFSMAFGHAGDVFRVIQQDYTYWTEQEGCLKPDMFDLYSLLRSQPN